MGTNEETNDAIDLKVDNDVKNQEKDLNPSQKKNRKRSYAVMDDFKEITLSNGIKKAKCVHCETKVVVEYGGDSAPFHKHLEQCKNRLCTNKKERIVSYQTVGIEVDSAGILRNFKYNHEKVREAAAGMIVLHECPIRMLEDEVFNYFARTVSPRFENISLTKAKNDCLKVYEDEKTKLKEMLKSVNTVRLTAEFWSSGSKNFYLCLTGHFFDAKRNSQKRILSLCDVPPPHTGLVISDVIFQCLLDWGLENKVYSITVDNLAAYDVALNHLKDRIGSNGKLFLSGKLFHQRSCEHIIDVMAQDGMLEIQDVIDNISKGVKYLSSSKDRLLKFSEIVKQLHLSSRKLILDMSTCWKAKYSMLASALEFREVFPRYRDEDPKFCWLPTSEDWERAEEVCKILKVFNDFTHPTVNTLLIEICSISEILNKMSVNDNASVRAMALKMKGRFDKFWGECHLLMAIAAVLDPRLKMKLLEYCFPEIYPETDVNRHIVSVRDALYELFNYYYVNCQDSGNPDQGVSSDSNRNFLKRKYDLYLREKCMQDDKFDLDRYLKEELLYENDSFDALEWWKGKSRRFRILSKMACDILSIPIIISTSESSSSTLCKAIDQYHGSLSMEMVQALICSADWLHSLRGLEKSSDCDEETAKVICLP